MPKKLSRSSEIISLCFPTMSPYNPLGATHCKKIIHMIKKMCLVFTEKKPTEIIITFKSNFFFSFHQCTFFFFSRFATCQLKLAYIDSRVASMLIKVVKFPFSWMFLTAKVNNNEQYVSYLCWVFF